MKLYAFRVFVDNLEAAKAFYGGTLGLPVQWNYPIAVGYDVGTTLIVEEVAPDDDDDDFGVSKTGAFIGCSLQVEDIDTTYAELSAKGVEFLQPPEKMDWGGKLAHFRDPSGNVLTLIDST